MFEDLYMLRQLQLYSSGGKLGLENDSWKNIEADLCNYAKKDQYKIFVVTVFSDLGFRGNFSNTDLGKKRDSRDVFYQENKFYCIRLH